MTARISLVDSDADRNAVYRFRYDIYVEEMKRVQTYADHQLKTIQEPLDETGNLLIAEENGRTVGTARFNVGVNESFRFYTDLYQLRSFGPFFPRHISITSKLMVAPEYRRSFLPRQLSVCCYVHGLRLGTAFDFIDCNSPLVPFFSKLGYRQVFPNILHPEYGNVVPMVLAMHDRAHLEKVRSPLARYARKAIQNKESLLFFRDMLRSLQPTFKSRNSALSASPVL